MELTAHGRALFRIRATGLHWWLANRVELDTIPPDGVSVVIDAVGSGSPGRVGPNGIPVLDGPGEYELRGVPIVGFRVSRGHEPRDGRQTAYRLMVDGVRIGFFGASSVPVPSATLGELAPLDIVLMPLGEGFGYSAVDAQSIARTLEAKIIVAYADHDVVATVEVARRFCRLMDSDPDTELPVLAVTSQNVPAVPRVVRLRSSSDRVAS